MNIYDIITYLSTVYWVLLAIRQSRGNWGWLFLILGLTDMLGLLLQSTIGMHSFRLYLGSSVLMIFALDYKFFDKNKFYLIPLGIVLIIPTYYLHHHVINAASFFTDIIGFLFFLRKFILLLFKDNKLNFFFLVISIYFLTGATKYFVLMSLDWYGVDLFKMGNIFQNILMLIFLFIRHDDERLSIQLKKKEIS